jgi:hypothetical protein
LFLRYRNRCWFKPDESSSVPPLLISFLPPIFFPMSHRNEWFLWFFLFFFNKIVYHVWHQPGKWKTRGMGEKQGETSRETGQPKERHWIYRSITETSGMASSVEAKRRKTRKLVRAQKKSARKNAALVNARSFVFRVMNDLSLLLG